MERLSSCSVYVSVSMCVCVCVYVQVSQHVNRTAYFSQLSPQAFLLHSSFYIVLHPTCPPLPFVCLILSSTTAYLSRILFLYFPLYFFSFTGCLVMFSTSTFSLALRFSVYHSSFSVSDFLQDWVYLWNRHTKVLLSNLRSDSDV